MSLISKGAHTMSSASDRILAAVDTLAEEAVAFTSDLIRMPTVNPPGELYEECARFIGARFVGARFVGARFVGAGLAGVQRLGG